MINKRDDLKTFVVIIGVCAICIVIALILSIKSNYDKLEPVGEYNVFFANVNYVNNYINCVSLSDSKCVYELLDEKYIEENNITYRNVFDYVPSFANGSSIRVDSMDFVQIGDNFLYYVSGRIYRSDYDSVELIDDDFSIIVMSDYDNLTYSLYPVSDDYKSKINSYKKINIDVNENNSISKSELIGKEQMCVVYLSDFIMNINDSYDLLSYDMREVYDNFEDYNSFVVNNISVFSSVVDKCKMEELSGKRVYTVIDNNENTYVFYEDSIMNYTVDFYLKEFSGSLSNSVSE